MVYITLDELKEILPDIFNEWMDGGDESWEWIFQEIEQKCHIGKRKKDKKQKKWKKKIRDDVDELQYFRHNEYEVKVNGIATKVNELSNKISHLSVNHTAMVSRVDRVERDIKAAKSMAQIAKQRTEVDYTKCSEEAKELNNELNSMTSKDIAQWYKEQNNKEAEVDRTKWPFADATRCESCKHISKRSSDQPCADCRYNGINVVGTDKWEGKEK